MPRFMYMVHLMEALFGEHYGLPPVNNGLVLSFKAAATGDRERFDRVVKAFVPPQLQAEIRALAEQTVFTEIERRRVEAEVLIAERVAKRRMPSKHPFPWDIWYIEIRTVLELLLGPPEGVPSSLPPRISKAEPPGAPSWKPPPVL